MAGNPLIAQGTINRLRASVTIPTLPELNVTSPFLGKNAIRLSFSGQSTVYIDTLTGAVTSPEPYLMATISIDLLKSQALSDLYKSQMELLALIGDITVRPDSAALSDYPLFNCSIMNVGELDFGGTTASYGVQLGGLYYINASLFDVG